MSYVRGSAPDNVLRQVLNAGNCSEGDLRYVCGVIGFESVDGKFCVGSRDEHNFTPLMRAVKFGNLTLCKFLINFGANVNDVGCRNQKRTPLMLSVIYGNKEIATQLLMSGALPEIKDAYGQTAEDLCFTHNEKDVLEVIQSFE